MSFGWRSDGYRRSSSQSWECYQWPSPVAASWLCIHSTEHFTSTFKLHSFHHPLVNSLCKFHTLCIPSCWFESDEVWNQHFKSWCIKPQMVSSLITRVAYIIYNKLKVQWKSVAVTQRYASQNLLGLLTFCTINLRKGSFGTYKLQSMDSHFLTKCRDQKIYREIRL